MIQGEESVKLTEAVHTLLPSLEGNYMTSFPEVASRSLSKILHMTIVKT